MEDILSSCLFLFYKIISFSCPFYYLYFPFADRSGVPSPSNFGRNKGNQIKSSFYSSLGIVPDKFKQPQQSPQAQMPTTRANPNANPSHALHHLALHPAQSAPTIIVPPSLPHANHVHPNASPRMTIPITADGFSSAVPVTGSAREREVLMGGLASSFPRELGLGLGMQAGK
jgi:hypothetical protein